MIATTLPTQKRVRLFKRAFPVSSHANVPSEINESVGFEKMLFNKQLTTLIHCPIPATGRYTIPATVETIGIEAFAQCKGLTSIIIPSSIKIIGCMAFHNCQGLTSLSIPDSINEIGYRAFSNCINILSVYERACKPVRLLPDSEIFHNVDKTTCILYVPVGSKQYYQQAEQWLEFKRIVEVIDFN